MPWTWKVCLTKTYMKSVGCDLTNLIFGNVGIVTRRPLVLQLQQTDKGEQEYAEFGHLPRRKFTDFGIHFLNIS